MSTRVNESMSECMVFWFPMLFKHDENHYALIKKISYKDKDPSVDRASELDIEFFDDKPIHLKGDYADFHWDEFQAALKIGRQYF